MEFLLEGQARHESQIQVIRNLLEDWMKLVVSYQTKADENQTKTDEKLAALMDAQLRTEGHLGRLTEAQAVTERKLTELAEAQKTTELKLQSFLDSMKNPRNGN